MLKTIDFREENGLSTLNFEFENWEDKIVKGSKSFKNRKDALGHYMFLCRDYTLQNFDKIRIICNALAVELPQWTNNLGEIDPCIIGHRIYKKVTELEIHTPRADVNQYLSGKLLNIKSALAEQIRISKRLNDKK